MSSAVFQQPFVRFMRLNGVAVPIADVVPINRTQLNTFLVSTNPIGKVKWKIYLSSDATVPFFDGGETPMDRTVHSLVVPPGTLTTGSTDYLLRVEQSANAEVICEMDLRTNP